MSRARHGLAIGALISVGLSYIAGKALCASIDPFGGGGGGGGVVLLVVPLGAVVLAAVAIWPWSRAVALLAAVATLAAAGWLVVRGAESGACHFGSEEVEEWSACGAVGDISPAWTRNEGIHFIRCRRDGSGHLLKIAPRGGEPQEIPLPAKLTVPFGPSEVAVGAEGRVELAGAGGGYIWLLDVPQRAARRIDDSFEADSPAWSGHVP